MLLGRTPSSPTTTSGVEPRPVRRTPLPDWLPFAALALLTTALAIRASGPIDDPDTWWHLRLGEEFRGSWSLSDPGSLTPFATKPWFATQWTLEVLASYVEQAFGLAGVAWLAGAGVIALAIAVYVSCRQRGSVVAAAVASSLCLLATSLSHGPRPQMASFILLAVVTAAWLRSADDLRPRWWIIPLTWLWACTHGMWFMGVLVGVVTLLGLLLDHRLNRRVVGSLSLVPALSVLAAALTPVGPKLILAPLATSKMAEFVTEWQPPRFSEFVPALAVAMIALVVITWSRGPRASWTQILLLGLAAGWILLYYRTIAVGAVLAAPLVAGAIQSWLPRDRLRVPGWESLVGVTTAVAIAVGLAAAAPSHGPAPLESMDRMNTALDRLPAGTIVYNEYELGGWLEWKHRNIVPTVDGMTDAYQVSHVASYVETARLEPGWEKFIDETNAQYALLLAGTPLTAALEDRPEWAAVVQQSDLVLLKRVSHR